MSYLDLVKACDNCPYQNPPETYRLLLPNDTRTHGLMRPDIIQRMHLPKQYFQVDHEAKVVQVRTPSGSNLSQHCDQAFKIVIDDAIRRNEFEMLHAMHSEYYRIIGANFPVKLERFTHALFGIVGRGAHLTAYVKHSDGIKIWVPRRSRSILTYPGKLDSTVAGGVKATDSPTECIVQEAEEEASLDRSFVSANLKSAGVLTYMTLKSSTTGKEQDLVSSNLLYIYDLELPLDMTPVQNDDEVEQFYLMSVPQIKQHMFAHDFKTNCAVVMIDFFIRHGIITPDEEDSYAELVARMHRQLPIPLGPTRDIEP